MSNLFFPKGTIAKIAKVGISESSIQDVFRSGQVMKGKDGMVKKYSGYEIGIFYARSSSTGEYVITHVWKRSRR